MMWGRQSQLRGIGLGELGCTRAITCEFGAGIEQGERCVCSFGGVSLSFSAEVFACVSEGGKGEEMALWFGVALFIYHRVLGAWAGTGVSLSGPGGEGLSAALSGCVSSWGCVCLGSLLSWSRSGPEQSGAPLPQPATFPLPGQARWALGRVRRKQKANGVL